MEDLNSQLKRLACRTADPQPDMTCH